jgi:hypothetical protein
MCTRYFLLENFVVKSMKIKPFIIGATSLSLTLFGLYLYVFPAETEYQQMPAQSYIKGATAPQFEVWEM